jgi:addiction module HigA family antidote
MFDATPSCLENTSPKNRWNKKTAAASRQGAAKRVSGAFGHLTEQGMALHVPPPRLSDIVLGKRGITADTALRFAKGLGTSPQFWMTLQMDYERAVANSFLIHQSILKNK